MEVNLGGLGRFGKPAHHTSSSLWLIPPSEADLSSRTLVRRCANCPSDPPPCPACAQGEVCSLIAGGCDTCPVTMCQQVGSAPSASSSSSSGGSGSSAAGPIAGGVIGGIVFVCIVTFLVWRLCIRNRLMARRRAPIEEWDDVAAFDEKDSESFAMQRDMHRDTRASMHSVRSIASTALTRASNVIQIAYIPGVTQRSTDSTPDLVPPVPPIPAASPMHSSSSTPIPAQDEHFFMPRDLRDSTFSDYTVERTSYGRSSLAPSAARGSVPSTAYRGSAIVHTEPALTAVRGKANPVAVKSTGKNSPLDTPRSQTPPAPIMNRARHAPRDNGLLQHNTTSPIVARLGVPKAVTVTKPSSNGNLRAAAVGAAPGATTTTTPPLKKNPSPLLQSTAVMQEPERKASVAESTRHNGDSSTFDDASSSDEESPADRSLMGHEKLPQFIKSPKSPNFPNANQGFRSPSSAPDLHHSPIPTGSSASTSPDSHAQYVSHRERRKAHKRSGSLNQIIEEAARKASKDPRHGGLGSVGSINWKQVPQSPRDGPFSDAHATGTP